MTLLPHARAGRTPIGIDLGTHTIKAAQLRARPDGGWEAERLACFPRRAAGGRPDVAEAVRLRDALRRLGFRGERVALSVPPELALTAVLELPPRGPGLPLAEIARGEFARTQNRAAEELEIAFWDLPDPARAAKGTHLMAVGCPTAEADALVETMAGAGLRVVALDHAASALARACAPLAAAPPATTAILDLGWSAASLALVASGVLIYERRMPEVSGRSLHEAVAKELSLDAEEAALLLDGGAAPAVGEDVPAPPSAVNDLVASHADRLSLELRLAFSYVARQYAEATVANVLLAGGGASLAGLARRLGEALEVTCLPVSPGQLAACGTAGPAGPAWRRPDALMAMGLAMFSEREAERQALMNHSNLIPLKHRRAAARAARLRAWGAVAAVELLTLCAATAVAWSSGASDAAPTPADVARREREGARQAVLLRGAQAALASARRARESERRFSEQPDWSPLLIAVSDALGDEGVLSRCEVVPTPPNPAAAAARGAPVIVASNGPDRPGGYLVRLGGLARSQAAASHFVVRLEELNVFDRIDLVQTRPQSLPGGATGVTFQIDCPIAGSPKEAQP